MGIEKAKILVTGGAGYIGSHTVLELISNGYGVVVCDNFTNSKPDAVSRVKKLANRDFPFYNTDVRDEGGIQKIFSEQKIGCVIHFAGLKAVGESVKIPLDYYANNLNSTLVLLKVMEKFGANNFIFSSSATVYSGVNEMPLTENSVTGNCTNPYGWTKYMLEQILRDAAAANKNLRVCLLRYFNPIGAHESGQIGEDPKDIPNNLMPLVAQTAAGKRGVLNIYGTDYNTADGTCIRDYIHVSDLAAGHVLAVKYLENHAGVSVFNLGTGKGTSVLEFIKAFEGATGVKIKTNTAPRRAGDLPVSYAHTQKAKDELGFAAKKSIEDACADTWRWQSGL
ncbi:MAG: UDP-glucose 4-epimerase GalE [Clostridiales bacterium]|jgi:UDP-glucose 4-epimerase|nr:UDP-glucose 4-epimerase GalE [Clostridiales bacterium]